MSGGRASDAGPAAPVIGPHHPIDASAPAGSVRCQAGLLHHFA